jgi:hypothetical protein
MLEPNGGLTAPAPDIGLSSARRPRSVNRRQTPRGKKIESAVADQARSRATRDGGTPAPSIDPGYSHTPQRPQPSIAEGVNTNIGAQLSRRVSSGAIDNSQAQQVASDRLVLERAFGPKWREHVFGNPKGAKGLPSYGYAGGSEVNQLRSSALKRAKAKLAE